MIMARSGHVIDTTGNDWLVGPDRAISWLGIVGIHEIAWNAMRSWVRHLIRNGAPDYVSSQHVFLQKLGATSVRESVAQDLSQTGVIGLLTFEAFKSEVAKSVSIAHQGNYLGSFIRWYLWNLDCGAPGFDEDVAATLDPIKIGKTATGQAVMRDDPQSGPLRQHEIEMLETRLRSSLANNLPLKHRVATWLFICFGSNTKNVRLIAEDGLIRTDLSDGTSVYEIRIPRIKKRTAGEWDQFRTRKLTPFVGRLAEELIAENCAARLASGIAEDDYFRPLLRSAKPRQRLVGTAFDQHRYRVPATEVCLMLAEVAEILDLTAADGTRLALPPRRLRYTFATKLVKDGASPQEVADALDHTDTQHVMVYFNSRSDIVRRLDLAIGLALAPIAQAFMGQVIRDEAQAARQGDQSSRIRHHSPTMKSLETVGSCGNFGFCGLLAPIACYTCSSFQAWLDAPHKAVFDALEAKRLERLSRGADPKMTQIHDRTMIAIADVIARCDAIHASEANK